MASLTAHLVKTGDHGRLGFHPDCPVCRHERLFGSLPANAVLSPRAQAALATGVLALSAVGPPAALAQEPDQQLEGGNVPGQTGGLAEPDPIDGSVSVPDGETSPAPGSELTVAPNLDAPAVPGGEDGNSDLEEIPVETLSDEDPRLRAGPPDDLKAPSDLDAPATPDDPPATAPERDDPASGDEAADPTLPPSDTNSRTELRDAPAAAPEQPLADTRWADESAKTLPSDHTLPPPSAGNPAPPTPLEPARPVIAPAEADVGPTARPDATEPVAINSPSEPTPARASSSGPAEQRILLVEPGDSLWSIAKRLLGPDASPAQIARKVSQLWDLNEDRIGTGRPDLLLVGTKLQLR